VKDENGDLLADSHTFWVGGRYTLLANVRAYSVRDVRQIGVHTAVNR
jgi:hypothetical protein